MGICIHVLILGLILSLELNDLLKEFDFSSQQGPNANCYIMGLRLLLKDDL